MDYETAKSMTSPCGLPCFHCPAHLASKSEEMRARVAEALGIPPEKAACGGCRAQGGRIPLLRPEETCKIFTCNAKRGIDFCHECGDFPCERLQPYADEAHYPHNTKMYQLCMMKKLGLERWAAEAAGKIWDTYRTKPFSFDDILY
jgi:hypothetical protein